MPSTNPAPVWSLCIFRQIKPHASIVDCVGNQQGDSILNGIKAFRAGLFLLLALVLPSSAMAGENTLNLPPAAFKPPAVGTKLAWKEISGDKTGEVVITAINGFKVDSTWKGKDRSAYLLCMSCARRDTEIDEKIYASLWPLTVGKKVTIDRVSGRGAWVNVITITGTEKLKTNFGTLDTYRVISKSESANSDWWGNRDYWYAPSVGWVVKFVYEGRDREYAWEMTGVTKQ